MVVSTSTMAQAEINSIRAMPRWFFRLILYFYLTVTVICGLPEKTGCPCALRTVMLGTVTVVLPVPTA